MDPNQATEMTSEFLLSFFRIKQSQTSVSQEEFSKKGHAINIVPSGGQSLAP